MSVSQWKHQAYAAKMRACEDYKLAVASGRIAAPRMSAGAYARQTETVASRIIRGA